MPHFITGIPWVLSVVLSLASSIWYWASTGNLFTAVGLAGESEFIFGLNFWVFLWGVFALVAGAATLIYTCCCYEKGRYKMWLGWWILAVLVFGAWNLFGTVMLSRAPTSVMNVGVFVYAVAWFVLVLTYFVFAYMFGRALYVTAEEEYKRLAEHLQ